MLLAGWAAASGGGFLGTFPPEAKERCFNRSDRRVCVCLNPGDL